MSFNEIDDEVGNEGKIKNFKKLLLCLTIILKKLICLTIILKKLR